MGLASPSLDGLCFQHRSGSTLTTLFGFNHGFRFAKDGQAVLLETVEGNTAIFYANDPREQDLLINGQQIGLARDFRTNHGYDPYTIKHYRWKDTAWYNYSIFRSSIFPRSFRWLSRV